MTKIFLLTLFLFFDLLLFSQHNVVINEIMYNPSPEQGEDDYYEFIELFNPTDSNIDISGWVLYEAVDYTFPQSTVIEAGHYIVISSTPDTLVRIHSSIVVYGPFDQGKLNNGGERLQLRDFDLKIIDEVEYNDEYPWTMLADGKGHSLELLDAKLNNSQAENWFASKNAGGTPGRENSTSQNEPAIFLDYPNGGEVLQKGGVYEIIWNYLGQHSPLRIELLSDSFFKEITAAAPDNEIFLWTITEDVPTGDNYFIRISNENNLLHEDKSDNAFSIVKSLEIPTVIISEIMYNPPEKKEDSLEYIELYNFGDRKVNMKGLCFSEGIDFVFPDTSMEAGTYLLVSGNAKSFYSTFEINSFEWNDSGLKNSGEKIELRTSNGILIDYLAYSDNLPWDTLADGYGHSLEFCGNPGNKNNPGEWTASQIFLRTSLVGDSIYGSPGRACYLSGSLKKTSIKHD